MRKKMMTICITGVLVLSILTGCSKGTGENQNLVTPTTAVTEPEASNQESILGATVTLGDYIGMTLQEVPYAEIEAEFKELIEEDAELQEVDRAAILGDVVNINYVGKKNGVAFEGGTDDSEFGFDLELGSGSFIAGFEEGLVGAVAGEVRDLNLVFPEDYHNEELRGQQVVFTVTVNKVNEIVLPKVNDAYVARRFGYATVKEAKEALHELRNKESFAEQVKDHLWATSTVENIPLDLLEAQKMEVIQEYTSYAEYYARIYEMEPEEFMREYFGFASTEDLEEYAEEYAEKFVSQELILNEIAVREKLLITEELYYRLAEVYAYDLGYSSVESMEAAYSKEIVYEFIQTDFILEYIFSKANRVK